MADEVKIEKGRRAAKALATRLRILDAAESLFIADGYASTTITAIAAAADVAVQTVYAVFGTKRAVLMELLAVRVVGDGEEIPLRERADWRAMEAEADPRRQLGLLAAIATTIAGRIAALYQVMAGAAASDPELAELYDRQQRSRYDDQRRVARALAGKDALRPGLSERHAADILWVLANPHTYRALVGERGWTTADYQRWLADLLAGVLLTPGDVGS